MGVQFYRRYVILLALCGVLSACAAGHTVISKRQLDVRTKMSHTIFLEPVSLLKKTVYVQVRNTTDKPDLDITDAVTALLTTKGYQVVSDPLKAHFLLQANALQVGRINLRDSHRALEEGYGAAIGGAVVGASLGSLGHHHNRAIVGGLAGAALASMTDAMIQDVAYTVIMDVQISERVSGTQKTRERVRSELRQGDATKWEVSSAQASPWRRYQTRVVSTANQVNLKLEQALPSLADGLSRSVAGIF